MVIAEKVFKSVMSNRVIMKQKLKVNGRKQLTTCVVHYTCKVNYEFEITYIDRTLPTQLSRMWLELSL